MKDYLKEDLSKEERSFIYGIIRNTSLKFAREMKKINEKETISLNDTDILEETLVDPNSYDFIDKILDTKILRDVSVLKPYSQYEKEKAVQALENIALNSNLQKFIAVPKKNKMGLVKHDKRADISYRARYNNSR